jgi:hypothetical protein
MEALLDPQPYSQNYMFQKNNILNMNINITLQILITSPAPEEEDVEPK